jgi:flagellum-specific peptidoglycan hydrolase FlgJ
VVRYLALISLTVFFASGLVVLEDARTERVHAATTVRGPDQILGAPRYSQTTVERYARSIDCSRYIMKTIPIYYRLAPSRNIAPDVLVAQAIVETGRGYYGGDSKPWNMAGIKKGGAVGDDPKDFEVPPTAYEGVRMHLNHMAAYTGKRSIGEPHDRFYDARAAQKQQGWWVSRISQLGDGIWATDPTYASKIRNHLDDMGRR